MKAARSPSALACVLLAASCAHAPPDVAPVLDIADRACVAAPALDGAVATVATVDGDSEKPSVATLTPLSPCLAAPDGKALYAVFALPDGGPYTLRIASMPLGRSLLAPRASVLDEHGATLHELPVSSFLFRGPELAALYRSHPGERYLLVRSDVASAGRPLTRVQETVQQTYASTGYATFVVYTGSDLSSSTTWALNGEVRVSVIRDKPSK